MNFNCLIAGRPVIISLAKVSADITACGILAAVLVLASPSPSHAGDGFPFDQELLLDAAPMRPVKRMPVLTVAADGRATIDLWCKTVPARVHLSDSAIKIETAPLPENLPQYMSAGQCSPQRMQADTELLEVLAQVTVWRMQGSSLELSGSRLLKFRASDH
jgi:heat shock protein HslJ